MTASELQVAGNLPGLEGTSESLQVWLADLDAAAADPDGLWRQATAAERARAERFRRRRDALRHLAGRRLVRKRAAERLGVPASDLELRAVSSGKPRLWRDGAPAALEVSLSRAGAWGAIALSRSGAVGVDIESSNRTPDLALLAPRVLTPAERATLAGLDRAAARLAFLRLWVRKEAYVKALGWGLGYGLGELDVVSARDGEGIAPLDGRDGDAADRWSIVDLPDQCGLVGALCAGPGTRLSFRRFNGWP